MLEYLETTKRVSGATRRDPNLIQNSMNEDVLADIRNKLTCPKCSSKIGKEEINSV